MEACAVPFKFALFWGTLFLQKEPAISGGPYFRGPSVANDIDQRVLVL